MKERPVLVVGSEPPEVPKRHRVGGAAWQFRPYILVAPYYGADFSGKTGGWSTDFVERVQKCEYPQYMWDRLPEKTNSSILRLDHIQPIGTDQKAYKCTPFCLGSDGLKILDEWVQWLMTGCLQAGGVLDYFRKELLELE